MGKINVLYPVVQPEHFNLEGINGCRVDIITPHVDERGMLTELINEPSDCAMSYMAVTHKGKARDIHQWHQHAIQTDRFYVIAGSCMFALYDGKHQPCILEMSYRKSYRLTIQPGVYHCYLAWQEDLTIINFPTHRFNPADELRIKFTDLEVCAPWIQF